MTARSAALRGRHRGGVVVAVSHADPIKAAVAQALGAPPRPLPAHRHRAVLHHRHRLRRRRADGARRELDRRRSRAWSPLVSALLRSRRARSLHRRRRRPARPARVLPAGARGRAMVTLKCEKEQVDALGEYLSGLLARLPAAGEAAGDKRELLEPIEAAWPVGSLGGRLRRRPRSRRRRGQRARRAGRRRGRGRREDEATGAAEARSPSRPRPRFAHHPGPGRRLRRARAASSSPPAVPPARCAASRRIRPATSARAATATSSKA